MDEASIAIIGAGVVGLAIAAELSQTFTDIVVLEKNEAFGRETSSRNSEVIHAGIYYPVGSLKAQLCVSSVDKLYSLCSNNSIPCKKIGKLIVATNDSEIPALEKLFENGSRNGVNRLYMLDRIESIRLEPCVRALAAIYSPDTGVIDSHSFMKYLFNKAASNGVIFAFNSEIDRVESDNIGGYTLGIGSQNYFFKSRIVVNCAGLCSDKIAAMAGVDIDKNGYRLKLCKGSYFAYSSKSLTRMLIYPVPHDNLAGLGVHAVLDVGGRLRFGPDAEYVDNIDYKVDPAKRDLFYEGASKIIKGLEIESFTPDMAGVRPKLQGHGEPFRDFVIKEESANGLPGFINLIGIESPGLTSALSIAGMVKKIVTEILR